MCSQSSNICGSGVRHFIPYGSNESTRQRQKSIQHKEFFNSPALLEGVSGS